MTKCFIEFLKKQDVKYYENFKMSRLSYIGIGGEAAIVAYPASTEELVSIVDFLTESKLRFKVVGAMSNLLPCDEFYDGVLISTSKIDRYYVAENILTVDCGAKFSKVISELIKLKLGGMESLYGIPGSVGGMVYMNAGAYGFSVSDFLVGATVYSPSEKRTLFLSRDDMGFSYRRSGIVGTDLILINASFELDAVDIEVSKSKISDVIKKRKALQPVGDKSLGSAFKRNMNTPVSRLIDELGLKGYRIGGAEVSKKHAGFIVNSGGATARDVKDLILFLKEKIRAEYKINVEEEIEFLD